MGKLLLAPLCAGVLLLAGAAQASIHAPDGVQPATQRAQELADQALPKNGTEDVKQFSRAVVDPSRCNYEYVEMYGRRWSGPSSR
jgi:hypothetical protein